jgi:hypothetical protein
MRLLSRNRAIRDNEYRDSCGSVLLARSPRQRKRRPNSGRIGAATHVVSHEGGENRRTSSSTTIRIFGASVLVDGQIAWIGAVSTKSDDSKRSSRPACSAVRRSPPPARPWQGLTVRRLGAGGSRIRTLRPTRALWAAHQSDSSRQERSSANKRPRHAAGEGGHHQCTVIDQPTKKPLRAIADWS